VEEWLSEGFGAGRRISNYLRFAVKLFEIVLHWQHVRASPAIFLLVEYVIVEILLRNEYDGPVTSQLATPGS